MATAVGTYIIDVLKRVGSVIPNIKYDTAKQTHKTLADIPLRERVRQKARRNIMNKSMVKSKPGKPFAEA
jgi:hypothetical protein